MLAVKVVMLCITAAILGMTLRVQKPEFSLVLSLTAGILVMLMLIEPAAEIISRCKRYFSIVDSTSAAAVLKAAGIAILSELGVQICSDAGESALAGRIRLAARLTMLGLGMPYVVRIFETVGELTSGF